MLSIIVPVYNTEKYLSECIDSILEQSYGDFELILVDDGSKDASFEICKLYQQKDARVKVYHKENSGVSAARNFGLSVARGEYISFCDSDDVLKPQLYEMLLDALKKHHVDRVCGGYEYLYPDGHRLYCKGRKADGIYKREELLPSMIDDGTLSGFLFSGVNNSIFKKCIIDSNHLMFDETIKYNEDSLFSFQYAVHSNCLYCLQSEALYLYRQHEDSSTRKRQRGDKYEALHHKLRVLGAGYPEVNITIQMKRRMVTVALWEVLDVVKQEHGRNAVKEIRRILRQEDVTKNMVVLDLVHMNRYKKVYRLMMKYRMAGLLYAVTKWLLPVLSKYLSR